MNELLVLHQLKSCVKHAECLSYTGGMVTNKVFLFVMMREYFFVIKVLCINEITDWFSYGIINDQ